MLYTNTKSHIYFNFDIRLLCLKLVNMFSNFLLLRSVSNEILLSPMNFFLSHNWFYLVWQETKRAVLYKLFYIQQVNFADSRNYKKDERETIFFSLSNSATSQFRQQEIHRDKEIINVLFNVSFGYFQTMKFFVKI